MASAVGTWWFTPSSTERKCGSTPEVSKTFLRSLTTSLGSICLASWCVPLTQAFNCCCYCSSRCRLPNSSSNSYYGSNRWSVIYVGLYNYNYADAGRKALQLLETRGWTQLVHEDHLIPHVLWTVCVVFGGCTGTLCMLLQALQEHQRGAAGSSTISHFVVPAPFL